MKGCGCKIYGTLLLHKLGVHYTWFSLQTLCHQIPDYCLGRSMVLQERTSLLSALSNNIYDQLPCLSTHDQPKEDIYLNSTCPCTYRFPQKSRGSHALKSLPLSDLCMFSPKQPALQWVPPRSYVLQLAVYEAWYLGSRDKSRTASRWLDGFFLPNAVWMLIKGISYFTGTKTSKLILLSYTEAWICSTFKNVAGREMALRSALSHLRTSAGIQSSVPIERKPEYLAVSAVRHYDC